MIFSLLMMLLVLFSVASVLFFIFYLLLPSLYAQKVNTSNPLFSPQEFQSFPPARHQPPSKRAVILCSADRAMGSNAEGYRGFRDCAFYDTQFETRGDCKHGCIGLGSCQRACPHGAISIVRGTAVVNAYCDGCGECLSKCPRGLIRLVDADFASTLPCAAYTRFNGSYEDGCAHFGDGFDLSRNHAVKPRGYAFWRKLSALCGRG